MLDLPNGTPCGWCMPVAAYDGAGDASTAGAIPGIMVWNGGFWSAGQARVFIYTGDSPEPYGWFTLQMPTSLNPIGRRPICVLSPGWTNPDYANGYPNPDWPFAFLEQREYDITLNTVSFRYNAVLAPRSTYAVDIFCPPKPPF